MSEDESKVYHLSGGEIAVWVDGGAICLQIYNEFHDPIDMGDEEAIELGELLIRLAKGEAA